VEILNSTWLVHGEPNKFHGSKFRGLQKTVVRAH